MIVRPETSVFPRFYSKLYLFEKVLKNSRLTIDTFAPGKKSSNSNLFEEA